MFDWWKCVKSRPLPQVVTMETPTKPQTGFGPVQNTSWWMNLSTSSNKDSGYHWNTNQYEQMTKNEQNRWTDGIIL